ncbi:MAG: hypothetical protein ACJAWL_002138 [Motiliproteus sp.]|jgi:hypothetical protein
MIKTVFLTFLATLSISVLLGSLFLNSLLGVFGLAATSVEALQHLRGSQRVVEQLKTRHQQKKLKVAKRLSTKATRRVASTALAAATIGTVAVVLTVTSLEVAAYCEEKKALQEDENLLYGRALEFDLQQCYEEGKQETQAILAELKGSAASAVANAFRDTSQFGAELWSAIEEAVRHRLYTTGPEAE